MNDSQSNCPEYVLGLYEKQHQIPILALSTTINLSIVCVLALAATLENGMIILAILRSQNLQTPSYLLITSLAFTDLLVGLVFHPLQIVWSAFYLQGNIQGSCGIAREFIFITVFLGALSFIMVTFISIDRYLALTLRHRYTIIVTKKRVRLLIVVVWNVSFAIAFLTKLEHLYDILCFVASFATFLLLSITCVFYIKSFRALHLYTVQVHAQQPNPLAGSFDVVRYKKTLKTMFVVLACLLLCYLPILCSFAALSLFGIGNETVFVFTISATFLGLNSSINPIIYLVRLRDIRAACLDILKTLRCLCMICL